MWGATHPVRFGVVCVYLLKFFPLGFKGNLSLLEIVICIVSRGLKQMAVCKAFFNHSLAVFMRRAYLWVVNFTDEQEDKEYFAMLSMAQHGKLVPLY